MSTSLCAAQCNSGACSTFDLESDHMYFHQERAYSWQNAESYWSGGRVSEICKYYRPDVRAPKLYEKTPSLQDVH